MTGTEQIVAQKESLQTALASWFKDVARDLPWRNTNDPYLIYLSEVILQQTRVDQGIPYFLRFSRAFPSVESLAAASRDDVLKQWEGLGYYSRARNLHRSAAIIVGSFGGRIPDDFEELKSLPGVGDYTAAAILSIAFRQPYAVLDSNVIRVLARLAAVDKEVSLSATRRQLQEMADGLLDRKRPGLHNEALMEVGALVCTSKNPNCKSCPLRRFCLAYAADSAALYPNKKSRPRIPHHDIAVGVIANQNREFLIQRRSENGMLGGLWEFPGGKRQSGETLTEACLRELKEELGIHVEVGEALSPVRHTYSHFKITLYAFHCEIIEGTPISEKGLPVQWVAREHMRQYAFPKANLILFDELEL